MIKITGCCKGGLCLINVEYHQCGVTAMLQKDPELQHFNCILITPILLCQRFVGLQFYGC